MTTLLWQTALLLLGAYFLGAFAGCLIRRTFFASAPARPADIQPTAVPPRRLEDVPAGAAAGPLSARGEAAAAPASAYLDRALRSEAGADARGQTRLVADERVSPAPGAPTPRPAEPPVERAPSSGVSEAPAPERRVRSIGTSAAAAAALAAATARQQAAAREAAARGERQEQSPLPAAASSSGQSSTSDPRVHIPAPPAAPATSTAEPKAAAPETDDLTRIRGIDSELQQRLNELGVRRYAEIAAWKKDDVRRISQALGFRGRIQQENWIEQAQILMTGGETAYSRSRQKLAKPSPDEGEQRPIASAARTTTKAPPTAVASAAPSGTGSRMPILGLGRDNLQRISRITADIERLLNAQGVSRYDQIAHWTTADVARFDQLLGGDGRISRENWIEQAQILARGGETAYSREFDRQRANIHPPRPTQLAEAIRAAQAEKAGGPPPAPAPEREPSKSFDLNKLRSVRSELFRTDEREAEKSIGPGTQGAVRADDLKRIRGIGVLLEKRLNSMGYRTYEQIANWTAADVERISRELDIPGRIEQENWIEQARILASGKQTEFARRFDRN